MNHHEWPIYKNEDESAEFHEKKNRMIQSITSI